jgi:NAD+ synthase
LRPEGDLDPAAACDRITAFVDDYVDEAGADGVVVNLSGGLDSTVTATLAVEALGPESVFGLILPGSKIAGASAQDAEAVADLLGIEHETLQIQPLLAQLGDVAPDRVDVHGNPVVRGNFVSRLRMALAYLAANDMDRLVAGTTNRSELLLGYFTKYGDGGADVLPIGDRYKTEVAELARELGVPEFVVEKQPTAGFWPGQTDAADLGDSYEVIDAVLALHVEAGLGPGAILAELDVDREVVERVLHHYESTAHKRAVPPTPGD